MPDFSFSNPIHADRHAEGGPDPVTPDSIGALPPVTSKVLAVAWGEAPPLSDTDLNTITTPGRRYTFRDNTNMPPSFAQNGYLEHKNHRPESGYMEQTWSSFRASYGVYEVWRRVADSPTSWSPWVQVGATVSTGSPEGRYGASRGAKYVDTAQTTGAREWAKTSDAPATTGWVVADGDTGWQPLWPYMMQDNITQPAQSRLDYAYWRRANDRVEVLGRVTIGAALIGQDCHVGFSVLDLGSLPGGGPAHDYISYGTAYRASSRPGLLTNTSTSSQMQYTPSVAESGQWAEGDWLTLNAVWTTDAPWPTSL